MNMHDIIKRIQDRIKTINISSIHNSVHIIKVANQLKLTNKKGSDMKCKIIDNQINQIDIKNCIFNLVKENEKYFIAEITRTTLDVIFHDGYEDLQRLKLLGYNHTIAVEVFEKYGIFLYATDLYEYIHAPIMASRELEILINEFGLEKITEEIALYLRENYPEKFGIYVVCIP